MLMILDLTDVEEGLAGNVAYCVQETRDHQENGARRVEGLEMTVTWPSSNGEFVCS